MSTAETEVVIRSAVPIPDLSAIDEGLAAGVERLKKVVQQVRPADLGRDLSRRTIDQARRILDASDDRRAAAMLRAAHPAVAANVFGVCQADRAARILDFMPTDTVGAVIPLAAHRAGIDPTVISGLLITTLVDASGLFIYLTIAKFIAQLHG